MTLRAKLLAIVGTAAVSLILLIVAGALTSQRVEAQLGTIQTLYLPRLELGAKLQGTLERLFKGFQDAAAARDADALAGTHDLAASFVADLQAAKSAVDAGEAATLRAAMDDYYADARAVSQRLITGETGEALVDAMSTMQRKQKRLAELTKTTTSFERESLSRAFAQAEHEEALGRQVRLLTSLACLALVFMLSWWLGRGVFASLTALTSGFNRFSTGDFTRTIPTTSEDELAQVAEQANLMAASLARLGEARAQSDWLKNGHATLARELRGELEPKEAATRATGCIARYLEAPAAALFCTDDERALHLLGSYSLAASSNAQVVRFQPGEGLVGQAALQTEILVVADPPADHLRVRSGLGESAPRVLALLPLLHAGRVTGVLEVALFKPWSELYREFFLSVQETLAIALEVARARAETRKLLAETQAQAQRLSAQEGELRSSNEELETQQEELRKTNEELTHRAAEMDAQQRLMEETNLELDVTVQRLAQKAEELTTVSAYKSQFLTNMSHELRTPLNSMLLLSHLLAENGGKNLTDKQVEFARTIHAAGQDLLALINQVLDLAKVEAGKQELRIAPVVVSQLADRARRIFDPLARDKGLAFRVETGAGVPETITSDTQRVEQILTNLLGNAFKFTTRGEVVLRISVPAQAHAIAFAVTDTGPGIAPEHRDRVFAPFEQVDGKSDRRYGGTGLGLGIARELAGLLGGEITLQSTVGRGSTFTLSLPQEAPMSDATHTAMETLATPKTTPSTRPIADDRGSVQASEPCLLIIEDDRGFADAFAEVIHAHGLKYLLAVDGESGLRLAKAHKPSGIILDVRLPDIDGFTVMERLRADPDTSAIPVHFASAADVAERGMASGAVGYLSKPAGHRDLVRVVESLVPKRANSSRVLVIEDDALAADSLVAQLAAEKIEAHRVTSAAQALAALKHERFGCMVLDLSLPDMDGLELLRLVQEQSGVEKPSIVIYTARAMSKAEAKRLEAYTEAIVIKDGQSGERLLNEIRLFVRRLKQGITPRHVVADNLHPADLRLEGRKILVVDDDMRSVYALSAALRAKGVEVFVADTGRAALESLVQHPEVEIVLMDMMMPEMDGYEAMRHIRENPRTAKLPIIALTAKAMKGDAEKCLAAGADDYLGKPIDVGRLLAMVQARLAKSDG